MMSSKTIGLTRKKNENPLIFAACEAVCEAWGISIYPLHTEKRGNQNITDARKTATSLCYDKGIKLKDIALYFDRCDESWAAYNIKRCQELKDMKGYKTYYEAAKRLFESKFRTMEQLEEMEGM